jgi:DDE superfamily endonuclease
METSSSPMWNKCCAQALHPSDVVVMDNLSAHKVSGVRKLIQAAGVELLYLPPYSTDLNPILTILDRVVHPAGPARRFGI